MAFRPVSFAFNFQEHKSRLVTLAKAQQSWIDSNLSDPKPEHHLYPDKYRPSGIGDNTRKKRKRNALPIINPNTKQEVLFHPVRSLMQKYGTKEDPIKLEDSDDDEDTVERGHAASPRTPANSKVKRVKVRDTRGADERIEAELVSPLDMTDTRRTRARARRLHSRLLTEPSLSKIERTRLLRRYHSFLTTLFALSICAFSELNIVQNHIREVLRDFGQQVRQGQERMRRLFDDHADRLSSGMVHMKDLAAALHEANEGAGGVVKSTESAIDWLAESGDEVL